MKTQVPIVICVLALVLPMSGCCSHCEVRFTGCEAGCRRAHLPGDPQAYRDCMSLECDPSYRECMDQCQPIGLGSPAPSPAYQAYADVDWPNVNPFFVDTGQQIELTVVDVDVPPGGSNEILQGLPADIFGDEAGWTAARQDLFLPGLQGDIKEVEFHYLPLSVVVGMTETELYDRGAGSPWIYIGVDDTPADGFTVSFGTTGLDDFYVVRIYLVDSDSTKSRFGFAPVNVVLYNP